MEPAFYLSTWGRRRGGSVDEASLSSRQDHHHRDHRAGPPVVCPGLSLPSARCVGGCAHHDLVSRSDQGRAAWQHARTKIDERRDEGELDIGLAGGRALSASSQKLSALVPFGNRCYERQKEGLCPKPPRRKEGLAGGYASTYWLEPCDVHARHHATSGMRHRPYPIHIPCHPMPCSRLLLRDHTWVSEGDFVRC